MDGNEARQHHYNPAFYLAGFTSSGKQNGTLYVHEPKTGKVRPSTPLNEATKRDLYRLGEELDGDPLKLEKALASVENDAARVFRTLADVRYIQPSPLDVDILRTFVGLQAVRSPRAKAGIAKFMAGQYESFLQEKFVNDTPALEESIRKFEAEHPNGKLPFRDIEGARELLRTGVQVKHTKTSELFAMLQAAEVYQASLRRRSILFVPLPLGMPDLVVGEVPVRTVRNVQAPDGEWAVCPTTQGDPDGIVLFPLNRRLLVMFPQEPEFRMAVQNATQESVSVSNTMQTDGVRWVYGATNTIFGRRVEHAAPGEKPWWRRDGLFNVLEEPEEKSPAKRTE